MARRGEHGRRGERPLFSCSWHARERRIECVLECLFSGRRQQSHALQMNQMHSDALKMPFLSPPPRPPAPPRPPPHSASAPFSDSY